MGTAPSWRLTPFHDPAVEIFGLNDGYLLRPPRFDRWYELHPLDKMHFRPHDQKVITVDQIPKGFYVRPDGHVEWLKAQAERIPVFLQSEPPNDWPAHAHRFPIEQIHDAFGDDYWASGPAYEIAQAVLEGYTEIWITGIHLSTEAEYREQRPQFEALINRCLGRTVRLTKQNGLRFYDGDVRFVLPEASPVMQHKWRYAYEPKPEPPVSPYRTELKQTVKAKNALIGALLTMPDGPDKGTALEQLKRLDVIEDDCRHMLRLQSMATEFPPIVASLGG